MDFVKCVLLALSNINIIWCPKASHYNRCGRFWTITRKHLSNIGLSAVQQTNDQGEKERGREIGNDREFSSRRVVFKKHRGLGWAHADSVVVVVLVVVVLVVAGKDTVMRSFPSCLMMRSSPFRGVSMYKKAMSPTDISWPTLGWSLGKNRILFV